MKIRSKMTVLMVMSLLVTMLTISIYFIPNMKKEKMSEIRYSLINELKHIDYFLTVAKLIVDENGEFRGVLGVDLNIIEFTEYINLAKTKYNGKFGIIQKESTITTDENGQLKLSKDIKNETNWIGEIEYDGNIGVGNFLYNDVKYLAVTYKTQELDWEIFYLVPESNINSAVNDFVLKTITIVIVALLLVFIFLLLGTNYFVIEPIGKLSSAVSSISKTGNLDYKILVESNDEFGMLSDSFNNMVKELKDHKDNLEGIVSLRTEEILESKEKFRIIADYTYDWESWFSEKGEILWMNPAVMRVTGYTFEECKAMEQFPRGMFLEEDMEQTLVLFGEALSGTVGYGKEFRIRKKDGTIIWIEVSWNPVYDKADKYCGFRTSSKDITKRKMAEIELEENENFLQTLINNSSAIIYAKNLNGKYLLVNDSWSSVCDLEEKYVLGKTDVDIFGDEGKKFRENDLKVINGKVSIKEEESLTVKGLQKYFITEKFPVFDSKGVVISVCGVSTDITDRVEADERIRVALNRVETLYKTSVALSSTFELNEIFRIILTKLQQVVPFNSASIQELDEDKFRIIYCEGFKNKNEIIGLEFPLIEGTIQEEIKINKEVKFLGDIRKQPEFIDMSENTSIKSWMGVPLIYNDELIGELTLDSNTKDFYNDDFADVASIFASQAASAIKNVQYFDEIQKSRDLAEAATRAKSDFLANMSHEIRTPMNAIIGLNSLLEKTEMTTKQSDYVSKVSSAANNLLGIINDILDFSKIEAGKLSIELLEFDLEDVLNNLSSVVSMKAFQKGIEFVVSMSSEVPINLIGDPLRIGQVLLNLSNNAIKFTEKGEVIIKVETVETNENRVILKFAVIDSGIGLKPEESAKLFKAFSQADESTTRKYGGTGLGLSISKKLIELMDGEIGVNSKYGVGSEFYFTASFDMYNKTDKKERIIPETMENLKVLVVDDNEIVRQVFSNYLNDFEFSTTMTSSGEKALNIIESSLQKDKLFFDVIILDWKMEGIDGLETWRRIKEICNDRKFDLPKVIMVTAYGSETLIKQAADEGIFDMLTKPINHSILYNTLLKIFGEEIDSNSLKRDKYYNQEQLNRVKGGKILLVEDNEINQQVAKETLESEGFWVTLANDGQEAIDILNENYEFDLILMDLQMPILDGYEAAKIIRENSKWDNLPIVALSADAMTGTRERVAKKGMNDYITKPIDTNQLFEVLIKWIKPGERDINNYSVNSDDELLSLKEVKDLVSGINVEKGLKRIGGNIKLYGDLLVKFKKNNEDLAEELKILILNEKIEEAIRRAHTIKGVAGNIGMDNMQKVGDTLEKALKEEFRDKFVIDDSITELDEMMKKIIPGIEILEVRINRKKLNNIDNTMNYEEVQAYFGKMNALLEEYDTEANRVFDYIRNALNDSKYLSILESLSNAINEYEFDEALELSNKLEELVKESNE